MTFSGNYFEHWERQVLSGEVTSTDWSVLANKYFKRETPEESKVALEAWADNSGVRLIWKDMFDPDPLVAPVVHFLPPR